MRIRKLNTDFALVLLLRFDIQLVYGIRGFILERKILLRNIVISNKRALNVDVHRRIQIALHRKLRRSAFAKNERRGVHHNGGVPLDTLHRRITGKLELDRCRLVQPNGYLIYLDGIL